MTKQVNGEKKQLTVKWIVINKKIIKFVEEDEKTYKLADNVVEYLNDIKPNVPVNVTIVDEKVTFIQVRDKVEAKAEEPKKELVKETPKKEEKKTVVKEETKVVEQTTNNTTSNTTTETYTVKAVSKSRDYYLFEECGEKEWFTVSTNIKALLTDVKKGDKLDVKIELINDGKKDVKTITFVNLKESAVVKTEPTQKSESNASSVKKTSYRDETSMDKRTALMMAKDIVVTLITKDKIDKEQIGDALQKLTKVSYNVLTSL